MTIIEGPWQKCETISFYPTPVWNKEPDRLFMYDENFKRVECKQPFQSFDRSHGNEMNLYSKIMDKERLSRYEDVPWQSCEIKEFNYSDETTPKGFLGTLYWSRAPGRFIDRETGLDVTPCPSFEGSVRDWYEILVDVIHGAGNLIHKKTKRHIGNRATVHYDARTILEHTHAFHPFLQKGEPFVEHTGGIVGALGNRFEVVLDPNQPHDIIKVDTVGHPETWVDVKVLELNIL